MNAYPKNKLFALLLLASLVAGCSDDEQAEVSVTVSLSLPPGAEVEAARVWALETGGASCSGLISGEDSPSDATALQGPEELSDPSSTVAWTGLPREVTLFFSAGQDADGVEIVRGCTRRQLYSGENQVLIVLNRVGTPSTCEQDADCDDQNSCTEDSCDDGTCAHQALGDNTACDDGLDCTTGESCQSGLCAGGELTDCSNLDQLCIRGTCLEDQGGCQEVPLPDGSSCVDGLFCTGDDYCQAGACQGGSSPCDDSDPCTEDICDESLDRCDHQNVERPGAEGPRDDPTCENFADDDCDGLTDLDDPDCSLEGCADASECPDDGNSCTEALCELSRCYDLPLEDGTSCPGSDACSSQYICTNAACGPGPSDTDADLDGYIDADCPSGDDCDDGNPDVHPGAEGPLGDASCADGIDDDCDGRTDGWDSSCWEKVCTEAGWCWESPLPHGYAFYSVWMSAADDVWFAGRPVMHYDGSSLRVVDTGATTTLYAAWGRGNEVWMAGWSGTVVKYDGNVWTPMNAPASRILYGLHGTATDLWVVGQQGVIYRLDSGGWHDESPVPALADLFSVYATASDDVWAVGRNGAILHRDASGWTVIDSGGVLEDLNGVFAIAGVGAWAVGNNGTILRYDDPDWTLVPVATGRNLEELWGVNDGMNTDLWIAGWTMLSGDGFVFQEWPDNFAVLNDIYGTSFSDVWSVGHLGNLLHDDGSGWVHFDISAAGDYSQAHMLDLWVVAEDDVWAAGELPGHVLHYDGIEWRAIPVGNPDEVYACVWATPDGSAAWTAGQGGTIQRFDGTGWSQEAYVPDPDRLRGGRRPAGSLGPERNRRLGGRHARHYPALRRRPVGPGTRRPGRQRRHVQRVARWKRPHLDGRRVRPAGPLRRHRLERHRPRHQRRHDVHLGHRPAGRLGPGRARRHLPPGRVRLGRRPHRCQQHLDRHRGNPLRPPVGGRPAPVHTAPLTVIPLRFRQSEPSR
jgi:hypothetical protein